jgi:DNA primase
VSASTPLAWGELRALDDARDLNWRTVPERLRENGFVDPWAGIDAAARALTKEMQRKLQIRG